jgi:hypothetical protein
VNEQASKPRTPLAMKIGLALWALALVWWFIYYAQYSGPFGLLGLKFPCITGATNECVFFQQRLRTSAIPAYHPIFWWLGVVAMVVGFVQTRNRNT